MKDERRIITRREWEIDSCTFEELELVPPMDWKPRCFAPLDWEGKVVCENYSLKARCTQCPYYQE